MINVSTYTNVANSLLRVYQGYTKGIRFLLIMFLTLTASTAWGETLTLNNLGASLTSTSNSTISTTTITATGDNKSSYTINYLQCKKQTNGSSHAMLLAKSTGAFISNKTAMPGNIKSVTVYVLTGAAGKTTYHCAFSTTECTSAYITGSTAVNITGGNSNKYTCTVSNAKYFCISLGNTNNGQVYKLDVEYEVDTPPSCTTNPTVSAGSHSNVTTTTATVSCTNGITSLGSAGCSITSYGFVYGTTANPTTSNTKVQVGTTYTTTSTAFTRELTGLTANTTYYVRPYATNGNGTAYGTQTSFKTLELPKYTVTLVPGSGTCAASVTETSAGAGVTLPTPTLDCGDWEFAGWKTSSAVTIETTTEPTLIPAGTYSPTSDITLYAVYQRTETTSGGGGSGDYKLVTSAPTDWSGTYLIVDGTSKNCFNGSLTTLDAGGNYTSVTISDNTITSNTTTDSYSVAISKSTTDGKYYIKTASGYYIGSTASTSSDGNELKSSTSTKYDNSISINSNDVTIKGPDHILKFFYQSGQSWRFRYYKSTTTQNVRLPQLYKKSSGSSTTTYYHSTPDCGTPTPTPTLTVDPTTLAFGNVTTNTSIQKTFTITGSNLTANATLVLSGIDPGMFHVSSTSVTPSAGSINQTITVTYTPTTTGSHNATLTISSTGAESKTVTLSGTGLALAAKYTVTFNAGSGSCSTTSLQETSSGAGVTLPTANPPATCATDGWKFAGWWTEAVTETTTSPGELLTADSNYKPASDCTLYAVYSITESNGGGGSSEITLLPSSFEDKGTNNYGSGVERTTTVNDVTFGGHYITGNQTNTPSGATQNKYLQCRANDATIYNKTALPGKITQIVVNQYDAKAFSLYCGSTQLMESDNVDSSQNPSGTKITDVSAATTMTWNVDDDYTFFALKKGSNAGYVTSIVITYSGGDSTTTYNSNPVCVASYSITYDFAGGTGSHCSNTSVPQGDSYTICDEAPTREGHTFQGWSDGTSTYAAGATITPSSDVTLTAVWKANTYTVTWNNNGDTDEVTYNHGDALVVPTAPASCDGVKEFVGWTTHSGYYHATTAPDDIFTTKTTPVTATATYYAVFATPGAGGAEFVLGESGTFKMYANVDGTNHYAQGGVSSSKLSSTTDILTASDYTLTYADGSYTIKQGTSTIGHSSSTNLTSTTVSTWTISEGANGSWRITSDKDNSRALSYSAEANAFKAYATSNLTAGNETYFDIEFGSGSDAHSDYTTICQTVESIEIANYTTEFFVTDEFAFGGTVTAHFDGGGTQDVTALAHFSGYNMNVTGTYTITVTYMGATATYEITVKPLDNAWVLTWNVSGKTNTGLGPRSVTKGSAIGTLPTPVIPDACAGKTFMGWTESNVVNSDGSGITYITKETVPTANTTYYAVFATVNNFCTQKPIDQIASGSKVVIVAVASLDAGGTTGKAISSRTAADGNNLASDDVFVLDEQINTPHSTCVWTLTRESGKYIFTQDGKYLNAIVDPDKTTSGFCKFNSTKDTWTISESSTNTYRMLSSNQNKYVEWFTATGVFKVFNVANTFGTFDMQFFVTANANGGADITDYTTGCAEYTITYYGFRGGYSTSSSSDGTIVLPVNSLHTVPNCGDVVKDHTNLGREFLNVWMTKPHGGHTFKPGDTFILTQDTTLYAQWKLETNSDLTTLPTDIEDLAGTDVYVYGGKTLNIQPGTTTINSLTLKGGIQTDGSYQMPSVWVPEGATLVRNSNKIYLDLVVNAKTWYPFAVPFETKNTSDIHYLHPDMREAATYGKHFDIKTYDGARRADVGEDKANNWVRLKRHTTEEPVSFKPGVGYIISAMAYPGTDTATIRIPMTVPNTWFANGEQAVVGTTERNTMTVTAHTGAAATEHQRHAGWNMVANPYLSNFTGGGIDATNGLNYINGELIINSGFSYGGEAVPYVTIPAYDFSYYTAHKLSDIKLSPEYSFFVQIGTSGTMNFTIEGRQQAPAALRSNMDNPRIETDIVISHNQQTADHTGLIIDDRYTTAYEIGADLEKMFGSAYNTTIYTLGNDVRLAYNALSHIEATIPIPLGFRAETDGEYTISLTNPEDILTVESIVLQDSYNNTTTNLLLNDYTFYTDRTQDDQRFVVYIVPHNNAPTDISTIIDNDTETRKVIHNHRLYIIHNGHVYDGVGQTIQ